MKIIVSHDIDHITAFEHKNMIVPKFLIRNSIELITNKISFKEYALRYKELYINKWHNLEELMSFNKENNIPATFFIGMNNAKGLDYSLNNASKWAKEIDKNGFDIGVHGISYLDFDSINNEYNSLKEVINSDFGIRMHYLRSVDDTFTNIAKSGYIYDSTILEDKNPYKIDNMWEFPLHIMDGNIMYQGKRWITKSLDEYKEITKERVEELIAKDIKYMTFLFHDRYFNDSFLTWKEWYIWSIKYFKSLGFEFISYKDAIKELEDK